MGEAPRISFRGVGGGRGATGLWPQVRKEAESWRAGTPEAFRSHQSENPMWTLVHRLSPSKPPKES